jgi:hypothetical protein
MKLKSISITPGSEYGPHKGKFVALAKVSGQSEYGETDIHVTIEEADLEPITAMIAQLVARNMAAAAEAFRADVEASLSPPVEHAAIAPPSSAYDMNGVPF